MLRYLLKLLSPLLRKLATLYNAKEREYSYKGIKVKVFPGVFHPGLFFSTKILLKFIEELELKDKTFLELGAGTGIISILAAKKSAKVTATDISQNSVKNIKVNTELNNVNVEVVRSDMFENISQIKYDFIIINPPYYRKDPMNEKDYAWFCGSDFEFFRSLFNSISTYINEGSKVFMILSEDCDIITIKNIAEKNGYILNEVLSVKRWGEGNYIFKVSNIKNYLTI